MKRISARDEHTQGNTHDHTELTATTRKNPRGQYKRGLDVTLNDIDRDFSFSSYGHLHITELKPVVSGDAVYGFIPANFRSLIGGTGNVEVTSKETFKASSGTTIYGYGTLQSFRSVSYKNGAGAAVRFGAIFGNPQAGTWSGAGAFTITDVITFGYSGTTFGIWYQYNGEAQHNLITVTGAAGGSENATIIVNDVEYTVPLTTGTTAHNAYEIAAYLTANGSGFYADQISNTVAIVFASDGAKGGEFSFTSGTATATFVTTKAGVTKSGGHIAQADWNEDLFDGFDPAKGNVYHIAWQDGYGNIDFYIMDPDVSRFVLVHKIKHANSSTSPNLRNPSMRVGCYAYSVGGTTSTDVELASISGFTEDGEGRTRNSRAFTHTKSITTTLTNILTIKNKRSYGLHVNQVNILPDRILISNDGTKNLEVQIRTGATVAGEPNYQEVGTNLISLYDTAGTTVSTNGALIAAVPVAKGQTASINLQELAIVQPPTLTLTVAAQFVAAAAAADVTATAIWYEDV